MSISSFNSYLIGSGEGVKEKLVPLIQGPSDTKELHMSRWLNEIRKPESLLAPDLLAFSVQVPQQGDDCRNSGKSCWNVLSTCIAVSPLFSSLFPLHSSEYIPWWYSFLLKLCSFLKSQITTSLWYISFLAHFPDMVVVFGFVTGTGSPYSISIIGDLMQVSRFV